MLFLLTIFTLSAQAEAPKPSLECRAIYRRTDVKTNRTTEQVVAMPVTFTMGNIIKYEADLQGRAFSLQEESGESLLAQITQAPDYTKGLVSRGAVDKNGSFNLSDVESSYMPGPGFARPFAWLTIGRAEPIP